MKVDMKRQVAEYVPDHPLELCGDVKIIVQAMGRITDQTSFVWFNTKWVRCPAFTVASSRAATRSSSTASWTPASRASLARRCEVDLASLRPHRARST